MKDVFRYSSFVVDSWILAGSRRSPPPNRKANDLCESVIWNKFLVRDFCKNFMDNLISHTIYNYQNAGRNNWQL